MKSTLTFPLNKRVALASMVSAAVLMTGCSGGGSSSAATSPRAESVIEGNATKGVIQNGLVRAYLVEDQNGVMVRSSNALNAPVRTDASGNYEIRIERDLADATIIVEIQADAATRMVCDTTEGCGNDASGNPIAFGEGFGLETDFNMSGVITNVNEGDAVNVPVTPLTHMMVARASAGLSGLTPSSIATAQTYVETALSLESGALDLEPADITRLEEQEGLNQAQLEMGVLSAAMLNLVNTADWDSVDEVLDHVADRLASGGDLSLVNLGSVPDVALDDLFYEANEISGDIVSQASAGDYSQVLNTVATETMSSYENVTTQSEQIDPVVITAQPATLSIDEGDRAVFSVAAQGGGSLSFQWRMDGVAIDGENSSTLTISTAELADAGRYDVIVSNSVGSVASLSALLQVEELIAEEPSEPETRIASIELSWNIPTQREDGSDLEMYEIDGYVIAYGTQSGNLTQTVEVSGASEQALVIDDLTSGTYYFSIATVDSEGTTGAFSSEIAQQVL